MATTTPNNGWSVPTSTDYVKDGASAIETLGDAIDASVGTGLLAWQSWAPTLSGGWANGNGTWTVAKYCKLGKTVFVKASFTIGSTTTKGTNFLVSLPFTAVTHANVNEAAGLVYWTPAGIASVGEIYVVSTTTARAMAMKTDGAYLDLTQATATVPGTWATNNTITFNFSYEAA